ncbi:hypothetical protein J437_LFUL011416 [Ladona fulva]|uniref:MADF domain-containing protein n=1 Tax=Ladona fulva TaxID=123851 RepID=A0A8K0P620_LADFU|nr:hypothetical protein J437_LFUL011416 [Ladona fulva]
MPPWTWREQVLSVCVQLKRQVSRSVCGVFRFTKIIHLPHDMSDLRTVSRKFLSEFIALYRSHPCLWKVKSKEYSDRNKKYVAYEELRIKLLEIDSEATKDKVLKKINSLRTCFRKELKKVYESLESEKVAEDIYKPSLWYYEDLTFLVDQELPIKGISNVNSAELDGEEYGMNEPVEGVDISKVSLSEEKPSNLSCSKKKQKVDSSDDVQNLAPTRLEEGKFFMFGKHIAQELQALPYEMALYCKKVINEAIFEAQMGTLNRSSRIVTDMSEPEIEVQRQYVSPCSWYIKRRRKSAVPEVPHQ